jgi:uncharacterized OB-fold protein
MTAKEKTWPGVELSAKEFYGKVTSVKFRPEAKFAWSAGEAMSRFLDELKAGLLVARTCRKCERILFPPRMFCEECFRPTDAWTYVKDTGTIETFSISYIDLDAKRIKDPVYVGVVSVDGASPKMGILHYFGEVTPDTIKIGLRVKAVWKPPHEREGSVLDIRYWRPLREGEE